MWYKLFDGIYTYMQVKLVAGVANFDSNHTIILYHDGTQPAHLPTMVDGFLPRMFMQETMVICIVRHATIV